ncbi:4Fe-4S binding protein [Vibrio sp. 10N.261.51.F12]|uniref:4Fe-4S binding protein n=1 Tax=Vibrio sp. 10N.261.51.F12 TaxID=3229679 RepID=UPI00354EB22D
MPDKDERYYKAYMEHNTISRRGLFRALSGGAKRSTSQSSRAIRSSHHELDSSVVIRSVARPPGAVEEFLFQQICNECGDCAAKCPEQVILMNNGLAELNLDYGYCAQCGVCQQACPTGALHAQNNDIQLRPKFLSACQNALFGECTLCAEQCPSSSISIVPNTSPVVDEKSCDGCGRCKQACPFASIELNLNVEH